VGNQFPIKPLPVTAPVLDEVPAVDEWGQLVRHVGDIDANITGGVVAVLPASSSTVTKIARSIVSVVLAAANADRLALTIYNDSTKPLYIRVKAGPATLDNWTVKLFKDDYYEVPFPGFLGEVTGIWATAGAGQARVTELTEP
jgi:ethanolamine utilization protein EutA (predicted chaperonin)